MIDDTITLEQLLETRHAELPVFLLRMQNTERFGGFGDALGKKLFRDHLMYWWELEERGNLLGAGPVDFGTPHQEGLAILMAPTEEEALSLAIAEPLHAAGWRQNTIRRWQLNEGLVIPSAKAWVQAVSKR